MINLSPMVNMTSASRNMLCAVESPGVFPAAMPLAGNGKCNLTTTTHLCRYDTN
ncbi:hypothetical protein J6590_101789 [Homalodisca vitripennis]|nr:hypothetical protein J6590_101789 [Homalodisca vitripennis]